MPFRSTIYERGRNHILILSLIVKYPQEDIHKKNWEFFPVIYNKRNWVLAVHISYEKDYRAVSEGLKLKIQPSSMLEENHTKNQKSLSSASIASSSTTFWTTVMSVQSVSNDPYKYQPLVLYVAAIIQTIKKASLNKIMFPKNSLAGNPEKHPRNTKMTVKIYMAAW